MKEKTKKKPFFARYLEAQELAEVTGGGGPVTQKYPSDQEDAQTMKYPSDKEEYDQTMKYPSDDDEGGSPI